MGQTRVMCDKCGINDAFYDTGGVKTCAVCALEEIKNDPIYIKHKKRTYEKRK